MFTGIITDVGRVAAVRNRGDRRFRIETTYDMDKTAMGASIACSGVCLTVVDKGPGWFEVEASAETLSKTTLGSWQAGQAVNLEKALALGDELGGHLVAGHVDGVAEIKSLSASGDSTVMTFAAPADLSRYLAPKGSVTLNGVSLTVNDIVLDDETGCNFTVNVIAHTAKETTFGQVRIGDKVNLEIDVVARYLSRLLEKSR
jgi:riboflavin synthase